MSAHSFRSFHRRIAEKPLSKISHRLTGAPGLGALHGIRRNAGSDRPTALGPDRLPVVSLTVKGRSTEEMGLFLDADWNIAVRTGLQCAPLAHEALGTVPHGSVRFSFGPFNTEQDVEVGVAAMKELAG